MLDNVKTAVFVALDFLTFIGDFLCFAFMLPGLIGLIIMHCIKRGLSKVFDCKSYFSFFNFDFGDDKAKSEESE